MLDFRLAALDEFRNLPRPSESLRVMRAILAARFFKVLQNRGNLAVPWCKPRDRYAKFEPTSHRTLPLSSVR